jgi:hypothetical protein
MIKTVDNCIGTGHKDRGMGCDEKLGIPLGCQVMQQLHQLQLPFRRQGVLRFIKKIQARNEKPVLEIRQGVGIGGGPFIEVSVQNNGRSQRKRMLPGLFLHASLLQTAIQIIFVMIDVIPAAFLFLPNMNGAGPYDRP